MPSSELDVNVSDDGADVEVLPNYCEKGVLMFLQRWYFMLEAQGFRENAHNSFNASRLSSHSDKSPQSPKLESHVEIFVLAKVARSRTQYLSATMRILAR
jgi:hypothetical protein